VSEDGQWTNVNKWMCDEGYAVPYVGQNKADVEALHMANREKLCARGDI
jgi:micrococcal nuclease